MFVARFILKSTRPLCPNHLDLSIEDRLFQYSRFVRDSISKIGKGGGGYRFFDTVIEIIARAGGKNTGGGNPKQLCTQMAISVLNAYRNWRVEYIIIPFAAFKFEKKECTYK